MKSRGSSHFKAPHTWPCAGRPNTLWGPRRSAFPRYPHWLLSILGSQRSPPGQPWGVPGLPPTPHRGRRGLPPGHSMHTHSQARTEQRDVHNSVYSASFCLCSVWMAMLKNKYKSIENSEVACICINFFFFTKRYSETTFCSDLAKPIHSL